MKKINTEKKSSSIKQNIPKSDSNSRKVSSSYFKIRETAQKNLFHEYKPKPYDEVNIIKRSSAKNIKDSLFSPFKEPKNMISNRLDKTKNPFLKSSQKNNGIDNRSNIKIVNNYSRKNSNCDKYMIRNFKLK